MSRTSYPQILTDERLLETQPHGKEEYPFQFYDEHMAMFDFHCVDWHWHPELEFVYVETGEITVNAAEETMTVKEGEGIFINTGVLHRFQSREDASIPNFVFSPILIAPKESLIYRNYIRPVLESTLSCLIFHSDVSWQQEALSCMKEITALERKETPDELSTVLRLGELWSLLFKNTKWEPVSHQDARAVTSRARVDIMMQFIQQNYMNNISLTEIAASANISKSTALSLFRRNLQTTPYDYLISCRLGNAAGLLKGTEKKINRISSETGFENVDYFCRAFKKRYHMTPTMYRSIAGMAGTEKS